MPLNAVTGVTDWTPADAGAYDVEVAAGNDAGPDARQPLLIAVTADARPSVVLERPSSGEVVSGRSAAFLGRWLDDVGVVRAEFSVAGLVRSVVSIDGGTVHFGGSVSAWDTTTLTDGAHTVTLTVFDTGGSDAGGGGGGGVLDEFQCGCSHGPLGALALLAADFALGTSRNTSAQRGRSR